MIAWILGAIDPLAKWMPSLPDTFRFGQRHLVDPFLIRFSEIQSHFFHSSRDQEQVSFDQPCQQAAGKIFIDYCSSTLHTHLHLHRSRGCRRRQQ